MPGSRVLLPLALVMAASVPVSAHIEMTSPRPRGTGQKAGPCGSADSVRGDPVSVFRPGETITVTWDETIDHPGHYRIAFDLDGDDDFPLPNNPNDAFPTVLADQIPDRSGGGGYGQEVVLPDQECDNCTLQLIQVMTTRVPYNSFYFQCADITLSNTLPGSPDADLSEVGKPGDECGCSTRSGGGPWSALLVLMAWAAVARTRGARARAARPARRA